MNTHQQSNQVQSTCNKQFSYAIKAINKYFHFSRAAILRSDSPCDKKIATEILQGRNTTQPGILYRIFLKIKKYDLHLVG